MEQIDGQNETPAGAAAPPGSVVDLARLVAEVYEHADAGLRHAVRDSLQAGIPASVLNSELSTHPVDWQRLSGQQIDRNSTGRPQHATGTAHPRDLAARPRTPPVVTCRGSGRGLERRLRRRCR